MVGSTGQIFILALFVAAGATALACHPTEDSCNIRTGGIYVEYELEEQGSAALARATFWVGDDKGGTNLVLGDCGDGIEVNSVELSHQNGNPQYYEASIDSADSYDFVFTREGENPYTSAVSAPTAVVISEPTGGTISRQDPFDVVWDASGSGQIRLLIEGECIHDYPDVLGTDVEDDGSYNVPAGDVEPWQGEESTSCAAELTLTRETAGDVDPSLKGEIWGRSLDVASFTSAP